jgi:hypothetical protein
MVATTDIQTDDKKQLAQAILERQSEMELVRNAYEDLWSDITTLVNQRRDDYLQTQAKGRKRDVDSWDGIANRALNIWADGMQGFMVSPAEVWARARLEGFEGDDEVRSWLQDYDRAMMNAFERSNFYSVIGEFIRVHCSQKRTCYTTGPFTPPFIPARYTSQKITWVRSIPSTVSL